ncbi:aminoglycoside phosphotransferase family protein [Streptomyces sp. NPDC048489]|uniref:aminoglycoside phosphotransferase family protein n=1 Tax=Streptomyces sp. NPDC048489 TaxID=3154504 RepID=UPI00341DB735
MRELTRIRPEVRNRLVVRFGPGVLAWCDELPGLVSKLAARWNLDPVTAGSGGTSRVFRCVTRDRGTPVWLKLTPDPMIAREETEALKTWAMTPLAVTLLAQDVTIDALLLEAVEPGEQVRERAWTLPAVAALLRDLRAPSPAVDEHSAVRPLTHRIEFVFDLTGRRLAAADMSSPTALAMLCSARAAAWELAAGGPVGLVHGDLHPGNVLSGPGDRLVAIDPRPAWGDPDFDTVDWVLDSATDRTVLDSRIAELAAQVPGMSPDRVLSWCRALAPAIAIPRLCAGRDDAQTLFLTTLANG